MRALPLVALATMLVSGPAFAQNLDVIQLPAEGSAPSAPIKTTQPTTPTKPLVPSQKDKGHSSMENLNIASTEADKLIGSIKFCASSGDNSGRLSCYDEIATRYGIKVLTHNDVSNGAAQWLVKNDIPGQDYIALLESGTQVDVAGNKLDSPLSLYVRCHNDNPSLYFKTGSSVGTSAVSVDLALDNSKFSNYSFMPSRSGEAFGIWSRIDTQNMINYLRTGKALVVHYTINNGLQVSAHFDISNIRQETESVFKACKL